jgi:hypothetical protein
VLAGVSTAEPRACPLVLLAGRTEDVEDDGSLGTGAEAMGHVARRLPEITDPDFVLDTVLSAYTATFE